MTARSEPSGTKAAKRSPGVGAGKITVYVGGSAAPPPHGALPEGQVIFAVAQVAAGIVDHAGEVP
ncbi:hypothetical protein [Nonomuraea sp. NPDC050540]|uniref:hypothetical protein n=1 Tax=Nonomuraea sp. NPDC050540 TaxID=3364367 RepID=UPI0037A9DCFB